MYLVLRLKQTKTNVPSTEVKTNKLYTYLFNLHLGNIFKITMFGLNLEHLKYYSKSVLGG